VKTVVVGASSGLGRCIAVGLARRGERVAVLARRYDMLIDAAREAGGETFAVACDVTDEDSCQASIEEAGDRLGGIDAVVYTVGISPLARLVDTDLATWRRVFDTNVVGASLVTRAALPKLIASSGVAAYLSSVSGSFTPPWPGLGAYSVSKAALDKLIDAWRGEHPGVGFTRVVVGDTAGGSGDSTTQMTADWDWDFAGELFPVWASRNYLAGSLMDVEDLVNVVHGVLTCSRSATIPSVLVVPRAPA
jgi:NAD(P)-dependent dehydrogenase (short-subunit alcohol dehydrogenase family)